MNLLGQVSVLPSLPANIARLEELAYNLWWSWEVDAQELYAALDPQLWKETNHNPVKLLHHISQDRLDAAAADAPYLHAYSSVLREYDKYMDPATSTWFADRHAEKDDMLIAYFSAEFGLHEALPIYSGGLGILSGDHCKAASDLGLPFIGVGFLYPQGYFTQRIDPEGHQQAEYEKIDFREVPARPALDDKGDPILINVDLPGRTVYAKIWSIQVGRVPIFLMDTDVELNGPQDRELSARLYYGDREVRISQEIVLGIGGVRAVHALGFKPTVWHMNEGHSSFLGLERVRRIVQDDGLSFAEAIEAARANTVFTTHTPVPAGNDAFTFELIDKFFWQYWGQLGIDRERFIQFARQELPWGPQYSMTVLALRLSAYHNGVSALHGHVSRGMWQFLWPNTPVEEVPIGSITNGVHTKTWLAEELVHLYDKYLAPGWRENVETDDTWAPIDQVPDAELWTAHLQRKQKLVQLARERMREEYLRHGEGHQRLIAAEQLLDADTLTIGFARRFATYKRAVLLFRDLDRMKRLLNDPERPVQLVFSGKAHPDDEPGKALIQQIHDLSQDPDLVGKVVFIENYDMNIARHLISGVDLWLNTPRRPREASGTSGQKAALSGVPNFSILDGWWAEAYDGGNGWSIGDDREYKDSDTLDDADAHSLCSTLEEEIIPLYYDRDKDGVPSKWVQVMKRSIRTCAPQYNMRRMVIDYAQAYYLPAASSGAKFVDDDYIVARSTATWKESMRRQWHGVRVESAPVSNATLRVGDTLKLTAKVFTNGLNCDSISVQIVFGTQDESGHFTDPQVVPMALTDEQANSLTFIGNVTPTFSGKLAIGIRAIPSNTDMINAFELGLVRWA